MNLGVKMQHKAPSHTTVESSESENSPLKQVHVVVGIVWKDNKFLVQQRPLNSKQFPGLWELPGGKIEVGETPLEALQRELKEELDISVEETFFWQDKEYYYSQQKLPVKLYFFDIIRFSGSVTPKEGQEIAWIDNFDDIKGKQFLEAIIDIVKQLSQRKGCPKTQNLKL